MKAYTTQKDISTPDSYQIPNWDQRGISSGYAKLVDYGEASNFIDSALQDMSMLGGNRMTLSQIVPGGGYQFGSGTVLAPGISWAADTDTGFYWISDGVFGVSANGVKIAEFNTSGGSFYLPSLTTGSVLFAGALGLVSQDNSSFFWDDTNNRLGLGNNSPQFTLDITGSERISSTLTLTPMTQGSVLFTGASHVVTQDNANFFWDDSNNRLGIGCNDPWRTLEVRHASLPQLVLSTDDNNAVIFQGSGNGCIVNGYSTLWGGMPFFSVQCDTPGITAEMSIYNTSSTAGAAGAKMLVKIDSAATGDAYYQLYNGVTLWSFGLDNSDTDAFVLSKSATLGTTNRLKVDTTGNLYLPIYTTGSIPFIGASGQVLENNASLFWDNAQSFLGLGTALPIGPLDVRGSGTFFAGIGDGVPMGNPTGTITTSAAAGGLTGTYKYMYYEVDGTNGGTAIHNTGYSPITTVVAAANQYTLTVPQGRKGTFGRVLCRTKAGGSVYYVLHDFGQGTEFHSAKWVDNASDASLTVLAPADADTTRCWDLEVYQDVKYVRSNPVSASAICDFTVLTGDLSNANSFSIHSYGTISAYAGLGNNFHSVHVGFANTYGHFYARFQPDLGDGASYTDVWTLQPRGEIIATPFAWTSGTPNLFKITGPAHTGLTASTEANDFYLNLNRTVTWAAGAITTQRAFRIEGPTYAFASASTITDAYTAYIGSAPAAGTNATLTRSWAFGVVGAAEFQGNVSLGSGANHCDLAGSGANMTCSGQIRVKNGTAGSPGYSFAVDGTCGFYSASATDYRFSIGSTDVYRLITTGFILPSTSSLQIGSSGIASPDVKLGRSAVGSLSITGNANGQGINVATKTELLTIAAAATSATTITIPVDAIVLSVSVRVTVLIPTAATFTVTGTTSATQFDVAGGVAVAAGTTDVGTRNCPYKNGAAQTITITPNLTPGANTGRVRVTITYLEITVATS